MCQYIGRELGFFYIKKRKTVVAWLKLLAIVMDKTYANHYIFYVG